jgi:hypothetical protein
VKRTAQVALLATLVGLAGALLAGGRPDSVTRDRSLPLLIPYHGVLEKDGRLVEAAGDQAMTFRVSLYNAAEGGDKVWPAEADVWDEHTVEVASGRFAFSIGSNPEVPYVHVADTPLWLQIDVQGPDEDEFVALFARQQLQSAPLAVAANRADTDFSVPGALTVGGPADVGGDLDVASSLDAGGAITAPSLALSGTATVNRLTFNEGSSLYRLTYEEFASTVGFEAGCPVNDFSRCKKLMPTAQGACFLSSVHGDLCCELVRGDYNGTPYWWLTSNTFAAHLRQCKAVCLKWN